jgi:predicted O-methyltransferase YrrM
LKFDVRYDARTTAIWPRIFSHYASEIESTRKAMRELNRILDCDLGSMSLATGTVSEASALCLNLISRHIAPSTVFEIGTYIGRSCGAMALAMDANQADTGTIYTCDSANNFFMNTSDFKTKICDFPSTRSTAALSKLVEANQSIDLFHIDGRIEDEDYTYMATLKNNNTIIALDDFNWGGGEKIKPGEKIKEKGLANVVNLMKRQPFEEFALVFPPEEDVTRSLGVSDLSTTALLIPPAWFHLFL